MNFLLIANLVKSIVHYFYLHCFPSNPCKLTQTSLASYTVLLPAAFTQVPNLIVISPHTNLYQFTIGFTSVGHSLVLETCVALVSNMYLFLSMSLVQLPLCLSSHVSSTQSLILQIFKAYSQVVSFSYFVFSTGFSNFYPSFVCSCKQMTHKFISLALTAP